MCVLVYLHYGLVDTTPRWPSGRRAHLQLILKRMLQHSLNVPAQSVWIRIVWIKMDETPMILKLNEPSKHSFKTNLQQNIVSFWPVWSFVFPNLLQFFSRQKPRYWVRPTTQSTNKTTPSDMARAAMTSSWRIDVGNCEISWGFPSDFDAPDFLLKHALIWNSLASLGDVK